MKIKGTVTPEIAYYLSGYDFDIRTTQNSVNLTFDNSHAKTRLVCYKLGKGKYEVEVIEDPLHLYPPSLDKGDVMSVSEIANVMIRQALKRNDMKVTSSKNSKKRKFYNVTGMEDGKLTGDLVGDSITCAFGTFIFKNYEQSIMALDSSYISGPDDVMYFDDFVFIPSARILSDFDRNKDANFFQIINLLKTALGEDRFKSSIKKSVKTDKNTGLIDLDSLFNVKLRDIGHLKYNAMNHTWSWVRPNGELIDELSNGEIISIIKYTNQFAQMYNERGGSTGNKDYLGADGLMEKLKEKRKSA